MRKILRVILWIVGLVLLIAFCVFLLLKVPTVQGFLKDTAVNYLTKKLDTKVQLGKLKIDFPKSVELDSLFIADRQGDTLLYTHQLMVEVNMLRAISGNVTITQLKVDQLVSTVTRVLPDTTFNFDFIIKAFSSGSAEPDTSSSSTQFAIHDIDLGRFHIRYKDAVTGYNGNIYMGKFKTRFDIFNLDSMHFKLDSIVLAHVNGSLVQYAPLVKDTAVTVDTGNSAMPDLTFKALLLDSIYLHYNNTLTGMAGIVDFDTLQVIPNQIALNRQLIDLDKLTLDRSRIIFSRYRGTEPAKIAPEPAAAPDTSSGNWVIKLGQLQVAGNDWKYDDAREPAAARGIDYNHVHVQGLALQVTDGYYSPDSSHAMINNIVFREKSGFDLKKLTTEAFYTAHRAELDNLDLVTARSNLTKKLAITYAAIDSIGDDPGNLGIIADLSHSTIDLNDVLYFHPALDSSPSMKKLMHAVVKIDGKINGKLNDLDIQNLAVQTAQQTNLALNAHITGLPDMDKATFNVNLEDFTTTKKDIDALMPASQLPASVNIPARMQLSGIYKGSLYSFITRLNFRSSDGNIALQGQVRHLNDSLRATYDARVRTEALNLGRLLKNDSLYGKMTVQAAVKGRGLTKNSADAVMDGTIRQAWLKGYNYRNVTFSGKYQQSGGQLNMQSADPNISFRLNSSADLTGSYPQVKANLDLDSLDLFALHLSTDTMKFRGKLDADFSSADIDHLNGTLFMTGWQIVKNSRRVNIDTMALQAIANETIDSLHLETPFATAAITGHYQLSKAGVLVKSLMEHYFGSDSTTQEATDSAGQQDMRIKLALFNHPLWQMVMPSLTTFSGAEFSGELSSDPQRVALEGNIPQVVFGDMQIDSVDMNIQSDANKLNYAVTVNDVDNGSLKMHSTTLTGDMANNKINVDMKVHDAAEKEKYHLAGLLSVDNNNYTFSFKPDSLLLNYEQWQMAADNYIRYDDKGILANNVKLEKNGQYLSINSPQKISGSPLEVDFHNFRLETLTKIASTDTAMVSGRLNGKAIGEHLLTDPMFTADLNVDSFALQNQLVGNIALKVDNKTANAYAVDLALTGDSNDLKVVGTYYTQPESKFDFNIAIPSLNIASAQAFTFGQVKDGSGILTGNLHLQGTTRRPQVNGALTFKNAALTVTKVNDYLRMPNETINFDNRGVHFNKFTLIDSLNNKAFIDGDILTSNFRRYQFALNITARNFRALNAKENADELYYGPVFISANVRVTGDQNLPKVDMDLKMNKNSILSVVLPGSNPEVESSEGIVEFIDASHLKDTVRLSAPVERRHRTPLTGIQLSANISVDTAAVLNLIIDPTNGDNLRVKGDATLNMTMDPGGKISLTGRYEVTEGAYSMSLQRLIKRKFDIKKGSTITWTGDPTSAILDLTALYNVEAPAMELVEDQLTSVDESTKNTYKQKLPFEVVMNIDGQLMKPDISFSLDMPETSRNAFSGSVYTRINQINTSASEVNKQVLGLLVLGHFIADNPFETSGGGGAEQLARQSASKILSQQLNNLAGDLIKGVDLNFDLQSSEDYSTGKAENKTNLNVGLSKSLFNDRTTVFVGSNIQLEGPQQADQKSSQIAGDVAIEYKLSRDGRYRLRGYRKNKYEGVIEGEFIETGISFIIVMDYNHFKELFRSRKNRRRRAN